MKQPPNSAFETKITIYENDQTLKSNSGVFDFVDILHPDYCNEDDGLDVICDQLVRDKSSFHDGAV